MWSISCPRLHLELVYESTICNCSRVFASLVAGLAAGVLGVTGWGGFIYYFLVHILVKGRHKHARPALDCEIYHLSVLQLGVPLYFKAQGRPTEYLQSG